MDSTDEKAYCDEEYSPYHYSTGQKIVGYTVIFVALSFVMAGVILLFLDVITILMK